MVNSTRISLLVRSIFIIGILCSVLSLSSFPSADAQDSSNAPVETLCYSHLMIDPPLDQSRTGTITDEVYENYWRFPAVPVDEAILNLPSTQTTYRATLRIEVTEGNLLPLVSLQDETSGRIEFEKLALNSDANRAVYYSAFFSPYQNLLVRVTRLGEELGDTSGTYKISLEMGLPLTVLSFNDSTLFSEVQYLDENHWLSSSLDCSECYAVWYFTTYTDTIINLLVHGDIQSDTRLEIYNYRDDTWQSISASIVRENSQLGIINRSLGVGHYMLVVRAGANEVGSYQLLLTGAGAKYPLVECETPIPPCSGSGPAGEDVEQLWNLEASENIITDETPIVLYQFAAVMHDLVTATVTRSANSGLDPVLVFSEDGTDSHILARGAMSDDRTSVVTSFQAPSSGCYYALVSRKGGQGGTTQGPFTLIIDGIPESPGPGPIPYLQLGVITSGNISAASTATIQTYRFRAPADNDYTVTADTMSGNLRPTLTVEQQGNVIATASANLDGDRSTLTFTATSNVTYKIVVSGEMDADGITTGDFALQVQATQ